MIDDAQVEETSQAETTAEASSAETQTPETTPETAPAATPEDSKAVKAVPYERFSEVVKTKNQLEQEVRALRAQQTPVKDAPQEDAIKQQLDSYLRELGYVNKEELEAKEADKQLENDMKSLSDKYSGKDGRPKFERDKVLQYAADNLIGNLEIAYKQMHEAELLDYAIKQATGKLKPTKTEVSDGSGSTQIGATQDDLLRQAQSGDDEAMKTLIKRAL
jgi:hypothetical protein